MDKTMPDTRPFASFEWMLAMRYLRARRKEGFISVISLFSFLGILLGVATLIVVMAVFNGFRVELLDKILGFRGHAGVYSRDALPIENFRDIKLRIEKIEGVTRVIALVEGQALASSLRSNTGALVRGISGEDIAKLPSLRNDDLRTAIKEPGTPDATPSFAGFDSSGGVAIGERMAWQHQLGLGSSLTIISPDGPDTVVGNTPLIRDYPVVAIFKVGMYDYDANVIYMPLAEAQDYFNAGAGATTLEVTVDDPDRIEAHQPAIVEAAGPETLVQSWKERDNAFFNALAVQRTVMFFVLTMIILVAALNIVTGLVMLVKDKGHDIAILRTMGATRGAIQRVFLITGAAIGVTGTLGGFIVGLIICLNVERIRQFIQGLSGIELFEEELFFLGQLPAVMDPWQTFLVVMMSLTLSFLATLYPAWQAARLDPVEALRYE
ncbi:MAG: lipoprotein-releasing ABC transporter permease subunit [Rhizobiales bacterium]|nr:lipoprotein-releasing ABC transporter permease subunit [Hyphomicrobiales bacterium]